MWNSQGQSDLKSYALNHIQYRPRVLVWVGQVMAALPQSEETEGEKCLIGGETTN